MTYDQLVTLDSIIKYGSFKAASEAMHKTQPSLSMAIKKLEEEFGINLFNREGYRPELTDEGKSFYKKAKQAIEQFQQLNKLGTEMGLGLESEITVCVEPIFPICRISHILQKFHDPYISTSLNLTTDVLEGVSARLKNHAVDFALGPDLNLGEDIEKIKILNTNLVPVVGKSHIEKAKDNLGYLKSLPQIVVGSSLKDERKNVQGAISKQLWYTSDFSMKEQIIETGLGWGRLPLHQIEDKIALKKLFIITDIPQVPSLQPIPMYLLRSKSKIMGPNTKRLWDYLAELREEL